MTFKERKFTHGQIGGLDYLGKGELEYHIQKTLLFSSECVLLGEGKDLEMKIKNGTV